MTNAFDQFDNVSQPNAFDQFDDLAQAPIERQQAGAGTPTPGRPQTATIQDDDWMPTEANLAIQQPAKPERSGWDIAEGLGEVALTLGTGATTGALGFLGGSIEAAIGKLTGGLNEAEAIKLVQESAASGTNLPESEAGQEYVKAIGDTLGVLPPILGMSTMFRPKGLTGQAKSIFAKSKSPLAKRIATEATGNVLKSFDKTGRENFKPRIWVMVKDARKQGFDDGMTSVIANASPMNKRKMRKQLKVLERGKFDAEYQAINRPDDLQCGTAMNHG